MLHLHLANRLEILADDLVARLGAEARTAGVLAPAELIVPSAAIARTLTLRLAHAHGVCANVRFSFLARWLWEQIARVVPGVAAFSPFEPGVLAWRIFSALADVTWAQGLPRLGAWLEQADPVMRFELAAQVARLFDQYLTYRPDWMETWAGGGHVAGGLHGAAPAWREDERWQAALWRRLSDEILGSDVQARQHPVRALAHSLADDGGLAIARLPAAAHLVALPAVPPVYLEALARLGTRMTLHVYALDPCREYWFDVVDPRRLAWLAVRGGVDHHEVGNRLLASWGRQAQACLSRLVEATGESMVDDARFEGGGAATLLSRWQDAVLGLEELAPGSVEMTADDRSLEVHVCHSRTRELEVLHDRLLGLFADDAARRASGAAQAPLRPSDILVVTPDLEATAPLIEAVFGTIAPERRLPFAVTGRARARVNAPARALLDLLALGASRFAVNDVLAFLQQAIVARRFGVSDDDFARIREWLLESGVHWALDSRHRASFDLPVREDHSFAAGLDRLFMAYALPDGSTTPFEGRLPAGRVEGSEAATLGVLAHVVEALATWQARLARPAPAAQWASQLADALAAFVAPDATHLDDLREVHAALERLASDLARAGLTAEIAPEVVRRALEDALEGEAPGGVPTGAITFASMASLRGVPYRVVCVVGLDDGAWPTSRRPAEFDLMAAAPRVGDRQRALDERNVFLDLLLAARERVHLSCTGRSVRDNAPLPPSVLVDELLDVLVPAIASPAEDREARRGARRRLVVEHPLQAFSESAFDVAADARLRSFDRDYAQALKLRLARASGPVASSTAGQIGLPGFELDAAAASLRGGTGDAGDEDGGEATEASTPFVAEDLPEPGSEWRDVPIERLVDFFRNPCRFLVRERLGVELKREERALEDDEPWQLQAWPGSPLVARVLPAMMAGASGDEARALALSLPDVPEGAFARRALDAELLQMQGFARRVRELESEPVAAPRDASITLEVDGQAMRVHGTLDALRPRGIVHWRYASRKAGDLVDAWLAHLLLCADAPPGVALVTTGVSRDRRWSLRPCRNPLEVLGGLLRLYARGLRSPLPFFPRSSFACVEAGPPAGLAAAARLFRPAPDSPAARYAEGNEAGVRLALRGRPDPFESDAAADFQACAETVFVPLMACLRDEVPVEPEAAR
jgi:exodeoxyribonuclease V gamma subunit